jgi:nucleotide-binding universal stress UspA family protein
VYEERVAGFGRSTPMNDTRDDIIPIIGAILHPTDFTEGSRVAFYHALKAALLARSKLTLLHVSPGTDRNWTDFPGVRETLERWGLLPAGSARSAVPQLGIQVRKVIAKQSDPVKAVLDYLGDHSADLLVLATHQHEGRTHWLRHSVAEPVARQAAQMTLFIPGGSAGFVSAQDGSVSLEHMLIPVTSSPRPQPAIEAAARLAARLNCPRGLFTLLHVGDPDSMPTVRCPEVPGWEWKKATRTGEVIDAILDTARKSATNLIVMTTDGRNGFLDALRGSHSERVLRHASAPVLTVPAGSRAGTHLG